MTAEALRDEEYAQKAQQGDAEAFGVLVERYQSKLLRYGRRFLSDSSNIEDLVQDSFIRAYEHLRSYDTRQPFSPWMYRIAHNIFVNALRSKSRSKIFSMDLDTLIPHAVYDDPSLKEREQRELKDVLQKGLSQLSPMHREVLILYFEEELSYNEIAEILHVPRGTVGVRLTRAKEALRKVIDYETLP